VYYHNGAITNGILLTNITLIAIVPFSNILGGNLDHWEIFVCSTCCFPFEWFRIRTKRICSCDTGFG